MDDSTSRLQTLRHQVFPVFQRRITDMMESPHPVQLVVEWNTIPQVKDKEARALSLYMERILDNLEWLAYDDVSRALLNSRLLGIHIRHVSSSLENSVNLLNGTLITLANFSQPDELPSSVEIRRVLSRGLTFPIEG